MEIDKLFRKSFLGGLNKKDVMTYIKALEEELARAQKEKRGGLSEQEKSLIEKSIEEIKKLKQEKEDMQLEIMRLNMTVREKENELKKIQDELREQMNSEAGCTHISVENNEPHVSVENSGNEEDYQIVKRILYDARQHAQMIIENANKEAQHILDGARKQAAEKKSQLYVQLQAEMDRQVFEFITVKYKISDYVQSVENIRLKLEDVTKSLKNVSEEIPAKVSKLLEDSEDGIIDLNYTEIKEPESGVESEIQDE